MKRSMRSTMRSPSTGSNAEAYHYKGVALARHGQYEEAVASFDAAIRIKSDYPDALYEKGRALYHLEKYKDAIAVFDQALSANPGPATPSSRKDGRISRSRIQTAQSGHSTGRSR